MHIFRTFSLMSEWQTFSTIPFPIFDHLRSILNIDTAVIQVGTYVIQNSENDYRCLRKGHILIS